MLTPREHEVLSLVAEGQSNAAVAARLFLAERTVETHMRSIFQKLRIPDMGDAHRRVLAVLAYLSHTAQPHEDEPAAAQWPRICAAMSGEPKDHPDMRGENSDGSYSRLAQIGGSRSG